MEWSTWYTGKNPVRDESFRNGLSIEFVEWIVHENRRQNGQRKQDDLLVLKWFPRLLSRKHSDSSPAPNKKRQITALSTPSSVARRIAARLHQESPSMASRDHDDDDDDFTIRPKRTVRKKKIEYVVSSDSDEPIVIEEKNPTSAKRKVKHRGRNSSSIYPLTVVSNASLGEIADQDLDVNTQRAIREQSDRDARIQKQQEREENARLERLNKQKEYNGEILSLHEQNQLPVAFELVLETDPRSGNIVIECDLMLVQYMKQHQGRTNSDLLSNRSISRF